MKVAVIGSGAWGTALAIRLCKNGHEVALWSHSKDLIPQMVASRRNPRLPGVVLPPEMIITGDYACARGCRMVVMASPSFPAREVCRNVAPYIDDDAVVVSATKGLEAGSYLRMSQVVAEETGREVVALIGPSHAEEVSADVPTGLVAAHQDQRLSQFVQDAFMAESFRVYTSPDPVGAELGAALKNVIALCAGVTDGLGYGDNTKALMMTRGLSEIARLGVALGAKKETFTGLSGVGDLIVTCCSMHSRNRRAGILIGQGKSVQEAMQEVDAVVEGYYAAKSAYELGKAKGVEMPIVEAAYRVLYEGASAKEAVQTLLTRSRKAESENPGWL